MSATTQAHTLQEYLDQATPMLMEIPGLPDCRSCFMQMVIAMTDLPKNIPMPCLP